MSFSDIFMPIEKVIEFMRTPINIGGFEFSLFAFFITILAMDIFITILWHFFLD